MFKKNEKTGISVFAEGIYEQPYRKIKMPKIFSSTSLKLIAALSMLIDHICMILYPFSLSAYYMRLTAGRIAMPIYVFLAAEGFYYTKSRKKYCLNIFIAAIISEPIYDLARTGSLFDFSHQNVCFSLLSGLLMLCVLNELSLRRKNPVFHVPVIAGFCVVTYLLNFSYDYTAIIAFAFLYYFHWHGYYVKSALCCASVAVFQNTPGAFFAFIPISMYSGEKGYSKKTVKYLFYIFYPAHLLILFIIKTQM